MYINLDGDWVKAVIKYYKDDYDKDGYDARGFFLGGVKDGYCEGGFNKEDIHKNGTLYDDDLDRKAIINLDIT